MIEFTGKKIVRMGTYTAKDNFGNTHEVVKWVQYSDEYKEYLFNKEMEYRAHELAVLKAKLEYQQKHYGQADAIDVAQYVKMLQDWGPEVEMWKKLKRPVVDYIDKDQYGNKVIKRYNA